MEMSRFLYEVGFFFARAQFVTLTRCPDVNANHPIERNYGNSVRFLAKIPNGTATQLMSVGCILLKKNLNVGAANRPAFCRQVLLFFTRNVPLKTLSRLAGLLKSINKAVCPFGGHVTRTHSWTILFVFLGFSVERRPCTRGRWRMSVY